MGSELRANYKCSLLSCQEQCPALLERASATPCHPDPCVREQTVDCWGGFVVLPALREGASQGRHSAMAAVPGMKSLLWDPQGEIESCLSHFHERSCRRKQGPTEPFSSVIIYYAINFNMSFRTGIVDCKQSSSSSPHILQVACLERANLPKLSKLLSGFGTHPPPKHPMNPLYF